MARRIGSARIIRFSLLILNAPSLILPLAGPDRAGDNAIHTRLRRVRSRNALTERARRIRLARERSGMRHSLRLDGVRHSPRLVALLGFVLALVLVVLWLVLRIAFARIQPVELVEFVTACELLDHGGIPHVYLSFPRPPKEYGETRSIVSTRHDRYRNLRKCPMRPARPGPS